MLPEIPNECYVSPPVEVTPDLARSRADQMKQLFRVQLLSKSVTDIDLALSVLIDLAYDLVGYDKALMFWRGDTEQPAQLKLNRGYREAEISASSGGEALRDIVTEAGRPILISQATCPRAVAASLLEPVQASSLLSMPIYAGDQMQGSLQLLRNDSSGFTREDAHLLRVFTAAFEPILESLAQGQRPRDYAFLDGTTGLFNRRYFEQQLEREIDRARRNNVPVSVLLVEVDQFDKLKTKRGHAAGESFLEAIAGRLRQLCRKSDTLARQEDDIFAIILPNTGKETLPLVARRVLDTLQRASTSDPLAIDFAEHQFNLSSAVYPEDAYSVESLLAACHLGIETARTASSVRYHQYPAPKASGEDEDIFDTARVGLLRGSLSEPSRLLNLFARLCLDTVPADRVSIMVREADSLVIQVALGFERQDEMIRTTRVPLSGQTVSAWVAQRREPLLVTGADEFAVLHREARASYNSDSFISFPLLEGEELLGVIHFSNRSDGQPFSQADVDAFRPIARVISNYLALDKNFANAQEAFLQNALFGLVDVVERQVPGMENHSAEVARLAEATARQMGYGEAELGRIRVSSRLHDLGYTSFRSRILAESRALSPRERTLAQRHPLLGWSFLESMPIAEIDRDAILYHHEREDGSGYFGKRGADIPATAKILAVADVYQALTSPRPYRPAVPQSEALAYLEGQKGTLFDSGVIEAFRTAVTSIN